MNTNQAKEELNRLVEKWADVIDDPKYDKVTSIKKRQDLARVLENQDIESKKIMNETVNANNTTNVAGYDQILIDMVRRSTPYTIAYDLGGVQPMDKPTGLIFSLKPQYVGKGAFGKTVDRTGEEALFDEADSAFTGDFDSSSVASGDDVDTTGIDAAELAMDNTKEMDKLIGSAFATSVAEDVGSATHPWSQMQFTIASSTVTVGTRALRANYTVELEQDLMAVHNMNAAGLLSDLMVDEINAEMNREVMRKIYATSKIGALNAYVSPNAGDGFYDLSETQARWEGEQYKNLVFQCEREANRIWVETRRGRANMIVTTADVVSAMALTGKLDFSAPLQSDVSNEVNASGCFAGIYNGRFRVYVDPYLNLTQSFAGKGIGHLVTVAYKGSDIDAGVYYCPYVPLQQYRTISDDQLQPIMAYKTRYGLVSNPFVNDSWGAGTPPGADIAINKNKNAYFRKFVVLGL